MNAEQFRTEVSQMKGLLPAMVEALLRLSDSLTDLQRADTVKRLSGMNERLLAATQEAAAIYEKGGKEVAAILAKDVPNLRRQMESASRSQESSATEGFFNHS